MVEQTVVVMVLQMVAQKALHLVEVSDTRWAGMTETQTADCWAYQWVVHSVYHWVVKWVQLKVGNLEWQMVGNLAERSAV